MATKRKKRAKTIVSDVGGNQYELVKGWEAKWTDADLEYAAKLDAEHTRISCFDGLCTLAVAMAVLGLVSIAHALGWW